MSNKLKVKPRKQRSPLAQSNQAAQAFGRAMVNCHSQIKNMEKEAYIYASFWKVGKNKKRYSR